MMLSGTANCGGVVVASVGGAVGWGWSGSSSGSGNRRARGAGWGSSKSCRWTGGAGWGGSWSGSLRYAAIVAYFAGAKSVAAILVFCFRTSTAVAGATFIVTSIEFVRVDTSPHSVS